MMPQREEIRAYVGRQDINVRECLFSVVYTQFFEWSGTLRCNTSEHHSTKCDRASQG